MPTVDPAFCRWLKGRHPNVRAAAWVGSRGRGDAAEGSDHDVWLIGGRRRRVDQTFWRGTPVTIFVEPWALVTQPRFLGRIESGSVFTLYDPQGTFERVMRIWARSRLRIQRANVSGAVREIRALQRDSVRLPPPQAIACLRRAGLLAVAVALYRKVGMLAPKWRHLEHHVSRSVLTSYRALQGLDRRPAVERWLWAPPPALLRSARAHGFPLGHALASARGKWRAGAYEDAVLLLRGELWRALGRDGPPSAGALRAFWSAMHGLRAKVPDADVAAVRSQLARLLSALKRSSAAEPDVRAQLADM